MASQPTSAATPGTGVAAGTAVPAPLPFTFRPQPSVAPAVQLVSYQQLLHTLVPGPGCTVPGLLPFAQLPAACTPQWAPMPPFALPPFALPPLRLHQPPCARAAAGQSEGRPALPAVSGPSAVTAAGPAVANEEQQQPFTPSSFLCEEPPSLMFVCLPAPSTPQEAPAPAAATLHPAPAPAALCAPAAPSPSHVAAAPAASDASPMHAVEAPSAPMPDEDTPHGQAASNSCTVLTAWAALICTKYTLEQALPGTAQVTAPFGWPKSSLGRCRPNPSPAVGHRSAEQAAPP